MRVLAFRKDGKLTYCTCPEELRGRGRCNHVMHMNRGDTTGRLRPSEVQAFIRECERVVNDPVLSDLYEQNDGRYSYQELITIRKYVYHNLLSYEAKMALQKHPDANRFFNFSTVEINDEKHEKLIMSQFHHKQKQFDSLMSKWKQEHPELYVSQERMINLSYKSFLNKADLDQQELLLESLNSDQLYLLYLDSLQKAKENQDILKNDKTGKFKRNISMMKRDQKTKEIYQKAVDEAKMMVGWSDEEVENAMRHCDKIEYRKAVMKRSIEWNDGVSLPEINFQ